MSPLNKVGTELSFWFKVITGYHCTVGVSGIFIGKSGEKLAVPAKTWYTWFPQGGVMECSRLLTHVNDATTTHYDHSMMCNDAVTAP